MRFNFATRQLGRLILASLVLAACVKAPVTAPAADQLSGAGATFPNPVYQEWNKAYNTATGQQINYQSIGSGGGIAQIKANTVDFGASDAPLTEKDLNDAGLVQFPMIMGGVVPVVNVPGVKPGELKLSGKLLADIFQGAVKNWNDPAIKSANPSLTLPDKAITVVHRSDGSGTTWIFTNYLDKASPAWHATVGTDKDVKWPACVGGKGNEGVSAYVQRIAGSVGYVEYAYALQNKMTYAQLQNKDGKFVSPTAETFAAAAASADWEKAPGMYVVLTDQPGEKSWPITGASFIIIHKDQKDAAKASALIKYFTWCLKNGQAAASKLDYVPMPDSVVKLVEASWAKNVSSGGNPIK